MKERFEGKVDEKGRVLIPFYFRERLGLLTGDKVNVEIEKAKEEGLA